MPLPAIMPSVSRATTLVVPPTLDVQLGQRFLERRLDGRDFFLAKVLFHRGASASNSFFSRRFIDRTHVERHVGQNRDSRASDFDKAFADGEKSFPPAFQYAQLSGMDRRQKRNVIRINAELSFRSGKSNHL